MGSAPGRLSCDRHPAVNIPAPLPELLVSIPGYRESFTVGTHHAAGDLPI
ncbi:hypothetical protein [Streptomyces sp. NPDC058674]